MEDFKILPLNLEIDKPQITDWSRQYDGTSEYEAIRHFILEDDLIFGLDEVILTNYEIYRIGEDEVNRAFSVKTSEGEIVGFLILNEFDLKTKEPNLFVRYIVLNPAFQRQGYGTEILTEIFSNIKKYMPKKPTEIFSYIHKENYSSQALFNHFGFRLENTNDANYVRAKVDEKTLEHRLQSSLPHNE